MRQGNSDSAGRCIKFASTFCVAAVVLAAVAARAGDITMPGGPTIPVGTLKLEGGRPAPVEKKYTPAPPAQQPTNHQPSEQPTKPPGPSPEDIHQGELLRQKAMEAFYKAKWREAIELLQQALGKLPGDQGLIKTIASARIALRFTELEAQAAEEQRRLAERQTAQDQAHVMAAIDRLAQAMASLRQEAGQMLIDHGQFELALRLPAQADFMVDSSVVDLREARKGVVDFAVLAPPASRVGDVQFVKGQPRQAEPAGVQQASKLIDSPAIQAVIFEERMGEAIGSAASEQERAARTADPVVRAVADRLGVDLEKASERQIADVQRKTREIWAAYDKRSAEHAKGNQELSHRSLDSLKEVLDKLTKEGIVKPGENLVERERNDPTFHSLMGAETRRIILEEEISRREQDRKSVELMRADVSSILAGKTSP